MKWNIIILIIVAGITPPTYSQQNSLNGLWGFTYGILGKLDTSFPVCFTDASLIVGGAYDLYIDIFTPNTQNYTFFHSLSDIFEGSTSIYGNCKQAYLVGKNAYIAWNTTRNEEVDVLIRDFYSNIIINTPLIIGDIILAVEGYKWMNYYMMGGNIGAGVFDLINSYQFNMFRPPLVDNTTDFWGGFRLGMLQGGYTLDPMWNMVNDIKLEYINFSLEVLWKLIYNAILTLAEIPYYLYYIITRLDINVIFEHWAAIISSLLRGAYNYFYEVNYYAMGYDAATVLVCLFPYGK